MPHTDLTRVVAAIESRLWAVNEAKGAEMRAMLANLRAGRRMTQAEARQRFGAARPKKPMQAGNVAVLPLYGVVCPRANNLAAYSGGTSCEGFGLAFQAAIDNDQVGAIIIDADTPGGDVQGAHELAQLVYDARGVKPIHTLGNHELCSAGFWIGVGGDEVVLTPTALTASIGIVTMHTEYSAAYERAGVKQTVLRSVPNKASANDAEPLSDEARASIEQRLADYHALFAGHVGKARGLSAAEVDERFGGGDVLTAKRAVKAGAADRIGTLDSVLAEYGVTRQPSRGAGGLAATDRLPLAAGDWNVDWRPLARRGRTISIPSAVVQQLVAAARPQMLAGKRAEVQPGVEDEPRVCPDCDELLKDGECPECGAAGAKTNDDKPEASAGGAAPDAQHVPPATAEEIPMSGTATAAQPGAAPDVNEALDTANAILAFADNMGYPAADARELAFKPGITAPSASNVILTWKSQQQAASAVTTTSPTDKMAPAESSSMSRRPLRTTSSSTCFPSSEASRGPSRSFSSS